MKRSIFTLVLCSITVALWAQPVFKAGWNNYPIGTLTHEYGYNVAFADSIKLNITDSSQIFTSPDSLVILVVSFPFRDKSIYKTVHYLNAKKLEIKTEDYKDDNLLKSKEWRYDDKGFKTYYTEENKVNGSSFRKSYDHFTDKKTGDVIVTETSYNNGRVEFYTKSYYDKKNVKYKEVRLNDNNKDVVHIESFFYGENGKLKERSIFFPEWHVTKKFEEKEGNEIPKCFRIMPVGIADKATLPGRMMYIKKVLTKNQMTILDGECHDFEFKFRNFSNCELVVCSTNVNNGKRVVFRYKEKP